MESKYNRYISNKRKSLATSNKQDLAREGSLLWCSFDVPFVARSGFEGDSEWYAPANECGMEEEIGEAVRTYD